jgi:hypothetical protein
LTVSQEAASNGRLQRCWPPTERELAEFPKYSPWDLTIDDDGDSAGVFVSNVVSGTVSRLDLAVNSGGVTIPDRTQIATGYSSHPNNTALIPDQPGWLTTRTPTCSTSRQRQTI